MPLALKSNRVIDINGRIAKRTALTGACQACSQRSRVPPFDLSYFPAIFNTLFPSFIEVFAKFLTVSSLFGSNENTM